MMKSRKMFWIVLAVIASVAVVVVVTLALTPQETNPAFGVATTFVNAAATGDDTMAFPLLSDDMQQYVKNNCPNGSVSACIQSYIPPEWGKLVSAVFRRAAPDGKAWDVDLIATYEEDKGVSGVCMFNRMEQNTAGEWRVYGWAGFLWCGDGRSRNMATNPDTPNRVP